MSNFRHPHRVSPCHLLQRKIFILTKLINFQHSDWKASEQLEQYKPEVQVENENRLVECTFSTTSTLSDPPVYFSLEISVALSGRESEVLKLLSQGRSNSQIARMLVISTGTANNHLSSIYSKLGVNSRTAAVRYALDNNLI